MSAPPGKDRLLGDGGIVTPRWLKWFGLLGGERPVMAPRIVGASPWVFLNTLDRVVNLTVSGGTVSAIAYSTDGQTFAATGVTAGLFTLQAGDSLRVTHAGAPTVIAGYWL